MMLNKVCRALQSFQGLKNVLKLSTGAKAVFQHAKCLSLFTLNYANDELRKKTQKVYVYH